MQRALLQWKRPDKRKLVIEALKEAGREDLIGFGPECLVRPDYSPNRRPGKSGKSNNSSGKSNKPQSKSAAEQKKSVSKKGWAKAKPKKNTKPGGNKRK
jgi:hypothetical protein